MAAAHTLRFASSLAVGPRSWSHISLLRGLHGAMSKVHPVGKVVDRSTAASEIPEAAPGEPVPLQLSAAERPLPNVFQNIVNFRDVGHSVHVSGDANSRCSSFYRARLNSFTELRKAVCSGRDGWMTLPPLIWIS